MQENWQEIIQVFDPKQSYVLATIISTQGATYRKVGTMMLINQTGQCTGLLSGGCLEADISLHAQEVLNNGNSKILSYDLKADAELLWGLGLGCDGAITLLLQPLTIDNHHLGFTQLIQALLQQQTGWYCLTVNQGVLPTAKFYQQSLDMPCKLNNNQTTLAIPISPPLSILICGAGPDVQPLVIMMKQLGWRVSLVDHRSAYLSQVCFDCCDNKYKVRAENISSEHMLNIDGVVIMSHNLVNDGLFLQQALASNINYIGLLGPQGRKNKLFQQLSLDQVSSQQVYGPIGMPLGGRSPQAIALSIVAEIQQHFFKSLSSDEVKPILGGQIPVALME